MQPGKQITIGEVSALSGLPSKTIRYYEENGIIESARRNENRYRTYSQADVQTLRFVAHARRLGFSLKDVTELLSLYRDRHRASKDVRRIALSYLADLDRKIADLTAIKNTIEDLARRCHGDDRPECPIIDVLETPADH
ncbi:MAG: Cu(I)-responsive transcriptional regulator [Xanthomonadaceae bacterium]|nr:Cu(I)-responsive transcriptional regulator [Xanthomonadaceae bacterium]MDE2278144.1 Cu(I)-responsive transcriptional regulator [Xanthomonadaceae bacterium]MDE2316520.1 Cu(I)-responsive transcriptional regulator [Xanthomonadaceae bacterium]